MVNYGLTNNATRSNRHDFISSRTQLTDVPMATVRTGRRTGFDTEVTTRALDRFAISVDASHYLAVPRRPPAPRRRSAWRWRWPSGRLAVTLRGGGSSLSGQAMATGLALDVRRHFRDIEVLDNGARVRTQPGATVRQVNSRLARYRYKLGPDPASEIACTIGGMVANNSSGMTCGTTANTYRTVESMVVVLPSGTVVDTGAPDADALLRSAEPELVATLEQVRDQLRRPEMAADIARRWSIKNTMGYGMNSFIDFDEPVKILEHLMVGSEGTLGFVAEATFRTVPVRPKTATGFLLFNSMEAATDALPVLVNSGADVVELLDSASILAMGEDARSVLPANLQVTGQASLLVSTRATPMTNWPTAPGRFRPVRRLRSLRRPRDDPGPGPPGADVDHAQGPVHQDRLEPSQGTAALLEDGGTDGAWAASAASCRCCSTSTTTKAR